MTGLPGFHLDAAVAARAWAAEHGHQQPDDRMLAAYGASLAQTLEAPDSPLCDCVRVDNPPTNPYTQSRMDHHCYCRAVEVAAILLGGYEATAHADQCVCRISGRSAS